MKKENKFEPSEQRQVIEMTKVAALGIIGKEIIRCTEWPKLAVTDMSRKIAEKLGFK